VKPQKLHHLTFGRPYHAHLVLLGSISIDGGEELLT
jgi:hypothetical protein